MAAASGEPCIECPASVGGIDPILAEAFAKFDAGYDKMVALPTLEKRRAASKALAPQIASMDRMLRAHGARSASARSWQICGLKSFSF
jgi:hypothetical protein